MELDVFFYFIKNNHGLRFIDKSQKIIKYGIGSNIIAFWFDEKNSISFNLDQSQNELRDFVSTIIRVEKEIYSEFYPIWTDEDGEILASEHIIKLNGRYYTKKYLELLLDKVTELKKFNL